MKKELDVIQIFPSHGKMFKKVNCFHIRGTTEDGVPFMLNLGHTTQFQLVNKKLNQAIAKSKRNYRAKDGKWIKTRKYFL